ncbi:type II CAAX prenyl endopeptidase Rce1 family protein [Novosphingobium piscinae]|uniref:CPBP family intramembrane metalloprotease n=1 Tax=Novosphingobium piscinae TaxID=1507448 RepID=A0A7X1FZY4_9SPHN|nr:CPBP family intramembrane glutamic endopeptidase [Novosphingobium piscinae]MBC2670088.1 CPBP family intramembrane metalloprotease [Novosphingobium piscinae]
MNGLIGLAGVIGILLGAGLVVGLGNRAAFSPRWLLISALLVTLNDALLTNAYRLLPNMLGGTWNWQGKLLALGASLAIAAMPAFGWRRTGLTLSQARGSWRPALAVGLLYAALFVAKALAFPGDKPDGETLAFQLTLPGLEEEVFYRGVLLLALDRAFTGRVTWLGVEWGWGSVLSCLLFGLAHAFGFSHGTFTFDPLTMALTGGPAFLAVWLRLRTGSLALPVVLHNLGNALP